MVSRKQNTLNTGLRFSLAFPQHDNKPDQLGRGILVLPIKGEQENYKVVTYFKDPFTISEKNSKRNCECAYI